MRKVLPLALMVLFGLFAAPLDAQAPPALPAELTAQVGLPGSPARFANITMEFGAPEWAIVGCLASTAAGCRHTTRVVLTTGQRTAFARLWVDVASMGRCEPAAFAPGDPEFHIVTPGARYDGHLPAGAADLPARTTGPCTADARLAWWLAQQLGA